MRLIPFGLTLVALVACTADLPTVTPVRDTGSPTVAMPVRDGPIGGHPCDGEAMVGVLTSTPKWLMGLKDETTGVETSVHWPNGFSISRSTDPRALLSATGAVLAYEGDLVSIPGEWSPAGGVWFACSNVTVL